MELGIINATGVLFGKKSITSSFYTYFNGQYELYNHESSSFEMEEVIISAPKKTKN
ncbi:hypothetical protein [Flavobacterium sp.]|uniref:hypothetical protein n=1 Tax=Flavobacterium sp. TaxID=239 RepID=UPI002621E538|nr:hypothetical protein [Flavobacterium sp.]MDD2986852.1 hypothetical protein [Flavobacterium sp.]